MYLVRGGYQVDGLHARNWFAFLGDVFHNCGGQAQSVRHSLSEAVGQKQSVVLDVSVCVLVSGSHSLVMPSDMMSVILQHEEIILMASLSTTST